MVHIAVDLYVPPIPVTFSILWGTVTSNFYGEKLLINWPLNCGSTAISDLFVHTYLARRKGRWQIWLWGTWGPGRTNLGAPWWRSKTGRVRTEPGIWICCRSLWYTGNRCEVCKKHKTKNINSHLASVYTQWHTFFRVWNYRFWGHQSLLLFLWGHWYPCFGLLVTFALGFKARVVWNYIYMLNFVSFNWKYSEISHVISIFEYTFPIFFSFLGKLACLKLANKVQCSSMLILNRMLKFWQALYL